MGPETFKKALVIAEDLTPEAEAAAENLFAEAMAALMKRAEKLPVLADLSQPTEEALVKLQGNAGGLQTFQNTVRLYQEKPPTTAFGFESFGRALHNLGHHEEAVESFGKALELHPNSWSTIVDKGVAHRALGQHDLALGHFNNALEVGRNSTHFREMPQAYVERGRTLWQQGDTAGALADFNKAGQLNPSLRYSSMLVE